MPECHSGGKYHFGGLMRLKGRWLLLWILVCGISVRAGTAARKNAGESSAAPRSSETQPPRAVPDAAAFALELAQLKEDLEDQRAALREQQQRITVLESELRAANSRRDSAPSASCGTPAPPRTETLAASQAALDQKVSDLEKQVAQTKKSFDERLKKIGPFSFSGDFRVRDEPFFGGPADFSQVRNRMRYRLRFVGDVKFSDEFSGGFALVSGDPNNPISALQTANQFFTRKPIGIDRAFLTYRPSRFKPLTLTGGKFAYPWYNTELTWDKDISPEGVAQTLAWNFEGKPALRRLAFVGFQLPFAETAQTAPANRSTVQSVVYGGQIQTEWQLAPWLRFSAYSGFYNWHNADAVALSIAAIVASGPDLGLLRLNSSGATNSAATYRNSAGTVTSAVFASKFALFDNIARFDIKTPYERWPLSIVGDFVQNTRACANQDNILPPVAGITRTFNAPCDPRQRRGYWLDAVFGEQRRQGDWQFEYTRMLIEREAVLGAFNFSEIRQGTNVSEHRLGAFYQAYPNIQLGFTGFFGRPLVTASSPAPVEDILKRLQFDVVYKF
jgi:hypothetical protein